MITTVEYVYIEDVPFVYGTRIGAYGEIEATDEVPEVYATLPAPLLARLTALAKGQDEASCGLCGTGVGFVLHQNLMGFESLKWTPTGLAREIGRDYVAVLCEVCTPRVPTAEEAQAAR